VFPDGAVLLDERAASLVCEIERVDDGGDHVIVLGRVLQTECDAAVEPLVHFRGRYRRLAEDR
jgi:flavin reductase (DIM6/NTAB) family NADH-FMN oxidoreductase RutF